MKKIKGKLKDFLLWSQKYTGTDMIYVARSSFWYFFGKFFYFLTSLAVMVAVANWLSKETYGAYRYVISTAAILNIFALPGLNQALVRAVAKGKEKMYKIVGKTKFKWSLVGSLACLAIAGWYFVNQNLQLTIAFTITGLFFPLRYTLNIYENFWQGKEKFDIQNKFTTVAQILMTAGFIPFIFFTDSLIWILFGFFLTRAIGHGIFYFITYRKASDENGDKETISFGKHLTVMGALDSIAGQIDKLIIWQFLGPVAVATLSFAQEPLKRIQGLIPISSISLPRLSKKNIKETKNSLLSKFYKLILIFIPGILLIILVVPYIYKLLFPAYISSVPYFRILSISLVFAPFTLLSTSLLASMEKKQLYIIRTISPIFKIILFLVLVPFHGIWGVVYAFLAEKVLKNSLIFYFFKKI